MENHDPDNPDQQMIHRCQTYARRHLNPIIDWTTAEVWEFIHEYNVPYCKLYDEGYKRLGCIGCPMGSVTARIREFERYPKYAEAYKRAFQRMIEVRDGGVSTGLQNRSGAAPKVYHNPIKTGRELFHYWLMGNIEQRLKL